ncbi:MAG: PBP1A family penicillin-binding protein [Hyphomicrobiaceae bacterium]|nr:PBP1A family penicillin-binding protein [Hyphomicrobiaceae bacterium]
MPEPMHLCKPSTADRAAPAALGRSQGTRALLRRLPWEIRLSFLAIFYLGPPALLIIAATLIYYTLSIPDPMALRLKDQAPLVRVLAADGSLLSERGGGDAYVPIDLMPHHLVDAVIATEDRRFFKHWGIDPSGMIRAAFTNLNQGRLAQGGSTLTQQLAKNLFLGSERTWARKIEEVILALWLEVRLGKHNILELYLNRVYFGAGAYGVETAAQRFFAKSARHVTLGEAAMLAGLLKAPSKYSPASHPPMARERANNVLAKMVEAGFISKEAGEEAARQTPQFSGLVPRARSGVEYAVDAALERLPALVTTPSNVVIETTIDPGLQHRAQELVQAALANEGTVANAGQAGVVFMDANGAIRALVGGRSYADSQFNRAIKARRQPGSAFKMFVYLAALESGLTPDSTVLDLPLLGSGWSPRNEGAGYRGSVTLRDALALSMNAAAARLNMTVGPRQTAAVAQRLGIRSPLRADASLALGTSEVTLIELTGAYGVLANGGRSVDTHLIMRVRTAAGKLLYERRPEPVRVLVAPMHVAAMNDMLGAVLSSGTGKRAALPGHAAAGKTGTSQDFRDAWFVGYAGEFVAGVWVGNDDGRPMHRIMGGGLPARLWRDIMLTALESRTPALLSGTGSKSMADVVAGAAPATTGPLLPREPIGADFVERAIADDEPEPLPAARQMGSGWVSKAKGLLRELGFGT